MEGGGGGEAGKICLPAHYLLMTEAEILNKDRGLLTFGSRFFGVPPSSRFSAAKWLVCSLGCIFLVHQFSHYYLRTKKLGPRFTANGLLNLNVFIRSSYCSVLDLEFTKPIKLIEEI